MIQARFTSKRRRDGECDCVQFHRHVNLVNEVGITFPKLWKG